MLLKYYDLTCTCLLAFILLVLGVSAYTYNVNLRRKADDPKKKNYDPLAIWIAPITTPLLLVGASGFFILRALLFTLFIFFFAISLLLIRKPVIFKVWDKFALWIGDPLLKVNTYLVRMAFRPWKPNPQPAYPNFQG